MKETNWHIITGAPCSGKTSVIHELNKLGYRTAPEVARFYLNQLLKTKSRDELEEDILGFQREVLKKKQKREGSLPPEEMIFFDRGLPDSIAYYENRHLNPQEVHDVLKKFRYKKVFVFDRLPIEQDGIRKEDEKVAEQLDVLIRKAYQSAGYEVISVPVMPIDERTQFVIEHSVI